MRRDRAADQSLLAWVLERGDVGLTVFLVAKGANVNATDSLGDSVLHTLLANGSGVSPVLRSFEHLVRHGANVTAKNKCAETPLHRMVFPHVDDEVHMDTTVAIARLLCVYGATWDSACESQGQLVRDQVATETSAGADWYQWQSGLASCVRHWISQRQEDATGSLDDVPVETIKRGQDDVATYLTQLKNTGPQEKVYRRKICVVGSSEGGKTSLIKSLASKSPTLVDSKDHTIGIDRTPLSFTETVQGDATVQKLRYEVTCWDFAGQDIYQVAHSVFFSKRTVYLLCVDLEAYAGEMDVANELRTFENEAKMNRYLVSRVFRWARLILARQPDADLVVVGTKTDKLAPSKIKTIFADLNMRLHTWANQWLHDLEKGKQTTVAGTVHRRATRLLTADLVTLRESLAQLKSGTRLMVSIVTDEGVEQARQDVEAVITAKRDRAYAMPLLYTFVLEAVQRRCVEATALSDTKNRVGQVIVPPTAFYSQLSRQVEQDLSADVYFVIVHALHDLGEVLWYEQDVGGAFKDLVILDPTIVLDIVREVVDHNHDQKVGDNFDLLAKSGEMKHALLSMFPFWKALVATDDELVYMFKQLLEFFHLAYPAGTTAMNALSDIIVPTYWKLKQTIKSLSKQESILARQGVPGSCLAQWEYALPLDLSEAVFDQFVVLSHTPSFARTVTPTYVQVTARDDSYAFATNKFVAWISNEEGTRRSDNVRIEVEAADEAICWTIMRNFVMAMESVLDGYPGLEVGRHILTEGASYAVSDAIKAFEDAAMINKDVATLRRQQPWLPTDLSWFIEKAWTDPGKLKKIEMRENALLVKHQTSVIENLVKTSDKKRLFPALWTLQYASGGSDVELRLLSDLSGACYHMPIVVAIPPAFHAKYGAWIQTGLSVLSIVTPSIISNDIINKVVDAANAGLAKSVAHGQVVHNLIGQLDMETDGYATDGSQPNTMRLLRDLLKLHDPTMDEWKVSTLSNLACAPTPGGYFVWAHPQEIARMTELEIRDPDMLRREVEQERLASVPSGSSPTAHLSSTTTTTTTTTTTASPPVVQIQFETVTGPTEWDWRQSYCYWELAHKSSTTAIQYGETSKNSDKACQPTWADQFSINSGFSLELLRDCNLVVKVKRPSRFFGKIKLISQGIVHLADHLIDFGTSATSIKIDVPVLTSNASGSSTPSSVVCLVTITDTSQEPAVGA